MKRTDNKGMTMVETIVSFTVLFIVLAALYGIVSFSNELYMKSVDTSRMVQKFYREIYKTAGDSGEAPAYDTDFLTVSLFKADSVPLTDENEEHARLIFDIDTEKTNPLNYNNSNDIKDAYIGLNYIGVESYVCTDETAIEKKLIRPKAVIFRYFGE